MLCYHIHQLTIITRPDVFTHGLESVLKVSEPFEILDNKYLYAHVGTYPKIFLGGIC